MIYQLDQLSLLSSQRKLVTVQPPILTVPVWSRSTSTFILSKKMLKRVGESRHPWRTPVLVRNHSSLSVLPQAGKRSCCCFSAGFLPYLGIVLQSISFLLFNLLVGFSVKFGTFSCILLLIQFSPFVAQL